MGESSTRQRPSNREPQWLRMMPLLGAAAGGIFGVVAVWLAYVLVGLVTAEFAGSVTRVFSLSLAFGVRGVFGGLVCGVAVGLVLMFLMGPHQRDPHTQRRAFVGAAVTHAVTLGVLMVLLRFSFHGFGTLVLFGSTLIAGGAAWWFQGRLVDRARLQDGRAD